MKDEWKTRTRTAPLHPSSFPPQQSEWRVFCAVELAQQVCDLANEHIRKLKASFPNVRAAWSSDEKFHITLKFLGEIPQSLVERFSCAADKAATLRSPFKLIIEGAGAFPERGPAKVLWLGVIDVEGGLNDLHKCLEDECTKEGFAKEARRFQPHLTLARLRESQGARSLVSKHKEIGFSRVETSVAEIVVFRSELTTAGSKYSVVSRHTLT
jgi:RNA 2',3'-cyclic 3'-phosphodiesterase